MMTVLEHLKSAGYDPALSWNAGKFSDRGTMECESISIRTFNCRPECWEEMLGVKATAVVPFTDGTSRPYPAGWPDSMKATITLYFKRGSRE